MAKRDPLRIRLARTKTMEELGKKVKDIESNPDSKIGASGLNMLNRAAIKKLDEITWAMYNITKKTKPEYIMASSDPETKNW